jgi:hypothetical protein
MLSEHANMLQLSFYIKFSYITLGLSMALTLHTTMLQSQGLVHHELMEILFWR